MSSEPATLSETPGAETPEARLHSLNLGLPSRAPTPIGAFTNVRVAAGLIYVSGQGPVEADGTLRRGKVGSEVTAEEARTHARLVAINILAALRDHLGSLDRVKGRPAAPEGGDDPGRGRQPRKVRLPRQHWDSREEVFAWKREWQARVAEGR